MMSQRLSLGFVFLELRYNTVLFYLFPHFHILFANDETAILAAKQCLTVMTTHSSTILKQYATALLL